LLSSKQKINNKIRKQKKRGGQDEEDFDNKENSLFGLKTSLF